MFTHNEDIFNDFLDDITMNARDCNNSYVKSYDQTKNKLNNVLFNLTSQYVKFYEDDHAECNVRDFRLTEQLELLSCYLEHNDYDTEGSTLSFKQNFSDLLKNVTGTNVLEFGKNVIFQTLEDSINDLQDEVDHFVSMNYRDLQDTQYARFNDDCYASDNIAI
jgi:hypothetical protein